MWLPPLLLGSSSSLHPGRSKEVVTGRQHRRRVPVRGSSEQGHSSFQELVAGPLLPAGGGPGENLLFSFPRRCSLGRRHLKTVKERTDSPSSEPQEAADGSVQCYASPFLLPSVARPLSEQDTAESSSFKGLLCQDAELDHGPTPGHSASHLGRSFRIAAPLWTISTVCFRGAGISVHGTPIRVSPVSSPLHEGCRGSPCATQATRGSHPELSRQLADSSTLLRAGLRTQGPGALAPRPSEPSGPANSPPCRGSLFSVWKSWTGPQRLWHVNCLELLAVCLALHHFWTLLEGKHVLVCSDNTAIVAYITHQGGLRSCRMSQLARHLLLWSQKHLRSRRAIHIPEELNRAADELSRLWPYPGEWRLHPQMVQLIWEQFGDAQEDLFASPDTSHCHWFYSLSEGTLGTDALAHSWLRGLRKYAFPPVRLLVVPYWPTQTWFSELVLLATAPPLPIPLKNPSGRDTEGLSILPPQVVATITSARALSTRHAYALKWNLFVTWCSSRQEDPRKCLITGGEPATAALGRGRPSLGTALYSTRPSCLRRQNTVFQGLRPVLCLLHGEAEGKGSLQAEVVSLDSGHHCLGLPGAGFTKIDFDYGLDIVDSQTSDRQLNQTVAQST
ncbi:hypothetical protein PO909_016232 [Leuciscus waleckii]